MNNPITFEARRFALEELAIRAGANSSEWIIEISNYETSVHFDDNRSVGLHFPHLVRKFDGKANRVVRCSWIRPDEASASLNPNFIVPFCPNEMPDSGPLFIIEGRRARCQVDLTASVLFSMCRIEERLSNARDQHGRFPATASIAVREDYLNRPIVDEYGWGLAEAIRCLLPRWHPFPKRFRAFATQDVDSLGAPFDPLSVANCQAYIRELGAVFRGIPTGFRKAQSREIEAVRDIARLASWYRIRSASFWKAPTRTQFDVGYDLRRPQITKIISELREQGNEIGVHPSYETFENRGCLAEEIAWLRESLGQKCLGGRQHYLRWHPETWADWENCGLSYDSSVGFAERPGFRAGTAIPYRPWLVDENRQANLLEIPLILMDRTLNHYMGLSADEALSLTFELIARTEAVGGVFTLLWHNEMLLRPPYRSLYEAVLKQLKNAEPFDCQSEFLARDNARTMTRPSLYTST